MLSVEVIHALQEYKVQDNSLMSRSSTTCDISNGPLFAFSGDPSTMPYLAHIVTEPPVRLQPAFSPQRTEYLAKVSYDVVLLKVWGLALHCRSEVRVDDKSAPSR